GSDAAVRGRAARAGLTGGERGERGRGERAAEGGPGERAAAGREVVVQLAANGFVIGRRGRGAGGGRGALLDAEGDGVGDELVAFLLGGSGVRRLAGHRAWGHGVVRGCAAGARERAARARKEEQGDPAHGGSMLARSSKTGPAGQVVSVGQS